MKKVITFVLAAGIIILMVFNLVQQKKYGPSMSVEKNKEYANLLLNKGLYSRAVKVYENLIESPGVSVRQRANLSYLAGNIYMEQLRDYENALGAYIRVKVLTPSSGIMDELNQKTVECLERLGKSMDARMDMEKYTSVKKGKAPRGATIVAKLGEREVTMEELMRKIKELPPYYQEMFKESEKQFEYLQQYIATELLYEKAKRKGYDKDKDIIARAFEAKKDAMMQKLMKEEVQDRINITDKEIELYYEGHKKEFIEKKDGQERQKSLEEAKPAVRAALKNEKEQELYKEFISKIFVSNNVKLYDDLFDLSKKKKKDEK